MRPGHWRFAFRILFLIPVAMGAQSLVDPAQIEPLRKIFDSTGGGAFRCNIFSQRPELDYALRFHTGYIVEMPMGQFAGSGHSLTTYVRVTPDGRAPVYLQTDGALPNVPDTKLDGELEGHFVVGEGSYRVEVALQDDSHRTCRNQWRIQARRTGSERDLQLTTPAGAVQETIVQPSPPSTAPMKIGRLTLLLHAASLSARSSKLQETDIETILGSLSSVLDQAPAWSVRLVVFNLAQHAVLYREDNFTGQNLTEVDAALHQLQLATVDYRTLQKPGTSMDQLAELVEAERQNAKPSTAWLWLGPRLEMRDDAFPMAFEKSPPVVPALFYLQYQTVGGIFPLRANFPGARRGGGPVDGPIADRPMVFPSMGISDVIEKLVTRLKGKTFLIHSPHEYADALLRINAGMVKTSPPADASAPPAPAPRSAPPEAAATRPTLAIDPPAIDDDPVETLMQLRHRILARGARVPNHTCVETIVRDRYEPVVGRAPKSCDTILAARKQQTYQLHLKHDLTDRLRLDVALAPDREIYSWAGASKFEEGEIDELVPEGAIGTGAFAAHLLALFESRNPRFVFEGIATLDGRTLMEYSFGVPRAESHYRIKAGKDWVVTGYTGTLMVDPKTVALVRFTISTDQLPPETNSCQVDTSLEYSLVQLDNNDYLLPTAARQRFISQDGREAENHISFSACRAYQAESQISFSGGNSPNAADGAPKPSLDLPSGLPVSVDLVTSVSAEEAAAGDRIQGRLAVAVRDRQQTLLPAGALLQGRLLRVETRHTSPAEYTIVLRWESVEVNGSQTPLSLRPARSDRSPSISVSGLPGVLHRRGTVIELPLPGEEHYAIFHSRAALLQTGTRTEWTTGKP